MGFGPTLRNTPFLRPLVADQQYLKFALFLTSVGQDTRLQSSIPIAMASAWSRRCKPSSCRRDRACGAWSVRGRPVSPGRRPLPSWFTGSASWLRIRGLHLFHFGCSPGYFFHHSSRRSPAWRWSPLVVVQTIKVKITDSPVQKIAQVMCGSVENGSAGWSSTSTTGGRFLGFTLKTK